MSRPTAARSPDDDPIGDWIAEAGDPRVEPRPEHLDRVRQALLQAVDSRPPRAARRWQPLARLLIASAGLVLLAIGLTSLSLFRPANAWARITQAVRDQTWIHIVSNGPQGTASELWLSPRFAILAVRYDHGPDHRGAEYHDLKAGTNEQYVADEDTIYRLREGDDRRSFHSYSLEVLGQLLRGDAFSLAPYPGTEIVEQSSREVVEAGKTWRQLAATIRWKEGNRAVQKMTIKSDPATGLPHTWDIATPQGVIHQVLDYPDAGPADILALGVPAAAKRVDRMPGVDLERLLAGMKAGRNRFDDYVAYVWYENEKPSNVARVWRKGSRWRVDSVHRRQPTREYYRKMDQPPFGVPPDADLAWWKRHEPEMVFEPSAICDGKTIRYYRGSSRPERPDEPHVTDIKLHMTQDISNSPDDPLMPWPHLMPEHQSHPNVYLPMPDREFALDAQPSDGPPGTVRVIVRNPRAAPGTPDLYRLWLDPTKNCVAMRAETAVFSGGGAPQKVEFVETQIIKDLDRSPSGFWYPTRVVRTTTQFPAEQVTRFLLDFRAEIPDSLFRPVD